MNIVAHVFRYPDLEPDINRYQCTYPIIVSAYSIVCFMNFRMMERAGVGPRSARALPWFENEREAYQHHAEYLKRLSKLRDELIREEQNNLANALDRLRMRSYGKEYVYSRPKEKQLSKRHSALPESQQRKTLITTLEKFQKMRPKKAPPKIMPLEGKSLLENPITERGGRPTVQDKSTPDRHDRPRVDRSVEESVRQNLQRLNGHSVASIPRGRKQTPRDMYVESSSIRKPAKTSDANNSSGHDERIAQIQRQRQKALRLRQEAQKAEQMRLAPHSFKLDVANDEDKMNMENLKDYYCVYYIPAPSPEYMSESPSLLPVIQSNQSCIHVNSEISLKGGRGGVPIDPKYAHTPRMNSRIGNDVPIQPCTCNCTCRMYVAGNKVEAPFENMDPYNSQNSSFYNRYDTGSSRSGSIRNTSREMEQNERSHTKQTDGLKTHNGNGSNGDKRQIVVDMPAIVFNTPKTPEPSSQSGSGGGLVKAFKQKELRQKELSNLMEDLKELNKTNENIVTTSL